MSEAEDVALEGVRVFNEGDWDALERLYDPDARLDPPPEWPEAHHPRGWAEVRAQYERIKADWSEDHVEAVSVAEVSPGVVLAEFRWSATGAASGLDLEMPLWAVYRFNESRIARVSFFQDEAPARASVDGADS